MPGKKQGTHGVDRSVTGGTRSSRGLSMLAFLLACLPVVVVWAPLGGRSTVISGSADEPVLMTEERVSLLTNEGWTVLIPFVVAAMLALIPVVAGARMTRCVVTGLFGLGVCAALASIGVFFVPALVVMLLAAVIDDRAEIPPPPRASA
jgi:hypothetical protein